MILPEKISVGLHLLGHTRRMFQRFFKVFSFDYDVSILHEYTDEYWIGISMKSLEAAEKQPLKVSVVLVIARANKECPWYLYKMNFCDFDQIDKNLPKEMSIKINMNVTVEDPADNRFINSYMSSLKNADLFIHSYLER
jgi:hypothetical protein